MMFKNTKENNQNVNNVENSAIVGEKKNEEIVNKLENKNNKKCKLPRFERKTKEVGIIKESKVLKEKKEKVPKLLKEKKEKVPKLPKEKKEKNLKISRLQKKDGKNKGYKPQYWFKALKRNKKEKQDLNDDVIKNNIDVINENNKDNINENKKEKKIWKKLKFPNLYKIIKDKKWKKFKPSDLKIRKKESIPKDYIYKGPKEKAGIRFFQSIKMQLLFGFMVPVVGIVLLGLISYQKASTAVINSYQESAAQTISSIESYVGLLTQTVEGNYRPYIRQEDYMKFFRGIYKLQSDGITADMHSLQKKLMQEQLNISVIADPLVEDAMFISDELGYIGTNQIKAGEDKPYSSFLETENGEVVKNDRLGWHWFGNINTEVDEFLNADPQHYAIRLVRKFDMEACLMIVDVKMDLIVNSLNELDPGKGGHVALVTTDGAEIYSSKTKDVKKKLIYNTDFYKKALKEAQEDEEKRDGIKSVTFNGEPYKFIYSKFDDNDFMVCTLMSEKYLISHVKEIKILSVVVVLIASIIAGAIGIIIASGISKNIDHIIRGLKKVAKGDFTPVFYTRRKDEFKLITNAVNDTVGNVKELISSVRDVNTELLEAAERVFSSSDFFVETSKNIKSSLGEINTGAYKLDDDSDNCLVQMDKLSEKIETVITNTEEIGKVAGETNESINAGMRSMEGVTESTNQTTKITGEVIESIKGLQIKSRSIADVANVINDIAEQTNLISINASIEAAKAGEYGRGFAVVAKEIIKLADESQKSAKQIGNIIGEILENTNEVVGIAKVAFKIVQTQGESVEGTKKAFGEMKENIDILLAALEHITHNVENMDGARSITLESVESISVVAGETAACSATVTETVESQNNAISDLDMAANTLSAKASQLTKLLGQFTV